MKIVVAFDTFKGCVNGYEASEYVASRLTEHGAEAYALPLADGGEGTARALALLYGGTPVDVETVDAYGAPTEARVYLLPEGVAAVDMASCVGLGAAEGTSRARVMEASSYGLGLLLRRLAETHRPASVLLGAGGSASCDGATGLLAALGARLRFRTHTPMRPAGRHLAAVEGLDMSAVAGLPPVTLLCDVRAPLLGPDGAALRFAPQKGATPAQTLTLDAGLRIDRHSHVGVEWVPQAGLSFHLPANAEIKLSAAKGFRYPTIREMYMFPPRNPDLKPERIWSYELAFSHSTAGGRLSYGINLFYIDGENLILRVPVDGRPMNINTGRIENAGVEAQIAWRISAAWSADANYSYLHMEHPVLAAPAHKLYAGASFTAKRWSASTGVQYVAGLYKSLDPAATEDFVLWNVRAAFRAAHWLEIWVRGENLLAQEYEINAGFPMPKATVTAGVRMNF